MLITLRSLMVTKLVLSQNVDSFYCYMEIAFYTYKRKLWNDSWLGWQTLEGKERMKMWEIQQKKKKINKEWNKNFKRCMLKFSTLTNFDVAPLTSREDRWLAIIDMIKMRATQDSLFKAFLSPLRNMRHKLLYYSLQGEWGMLYIGPHMNELRR